MKNIYLLILLAGITQVAQADISNPTLKEYFHLGGYYLHVGQQEKAIDNFREMINRYPSSREAQQAWFSIGDTYLQLAQSAKKLRTSYLDRARNAYSTALSRFPAAAAEARIRLGILYAFHYPGEEDTGRTWFRSVMTDYPEKAGKAAMLLADSFKREEKPENAFRSYQAARISLPEVAALASLEQADILYQFGDFSGASTLYAEVVNSMSLDGYFNDNQYRGTTLKTAEEGLTKASLKEGNPKFAAEVISSVIRTGPGINAEMIGRLQQAKLLAAQDKANQAAELLEAIALEYPQSLYAPRALFLKAHILDGEKRIAAYEKIRDNWPNSIYWVDAVMEQVTEYLKQKEENNPKLQEEGRKKATLWLKRLIDRYPGSPEAEKARIMLKTITK